MARALHAHSPRRAGPFVAVNCGALPGELLESELFGHVRGAFTGAVRDRVGRFELAVGGTLFLDEIGDLSLPLQVKLLRVLQERTFERVGESSSRATDARIVGATNRDLTREVAAGRFREDLYYRLNVIQIRMPPLRERREDIPLFLEHYLRRFAAELGRPPARLSPEAERLLAAWSYPGNVRELANVVERAATLCEGEVVQPRDLPPALRSPESGPAAEPAAAIPEGGLDLQAHLHAIERRILEQALGQTSGVKTEAARLLSLTFRSLRYRLAKYGIGGER